MTKIDRTDKEQELRCRRVSLYALYYRAWSKSRLFFIRSIQFCSSAGSSPYFISYLHWTCPPPHLLHCQKGTIKHTRPESVSEVDRYAVASWDLSFAAYSSSENWQTYKKVSIYTIVFRGFRLSRFLTDYSTNQRIRIYLPAVPAHFLSWQKKHSQYAKVCCPWKIAFVLMQLKVAWMVLASVYLVDRHKNENVSNYQRKKCSGMKRERMLKDAWHKSGIGTFLSNVNIWIIVVRWYI